MNYWLINPKNNGVGTNTSDLSNKVVYMGWGADDCPKFYNEVQPGDVIIICENAHFNNVCHFVGIAENLDKEAQCWHLRYSTKDWNREISDCIKNAPSDFAGGNSNNPWGPTKSIICLGNNTAENKIKKIVEKLIKEMEVMKMLQLLSRNHNIILHGAPGTGKTYKAREVAEAMHCDKEQIGFVQFHPSYDYSDFVEGLRPITQGDQLGFIRKDGIFKKFCKRALKAYNDAENKKDAPKYVFVIDEINRGDMSKIFGELFFSIDPSYRGEKGLTATQYQNLIDFEVDKNEEKTKEDDIFRDGFFVPENVYIIGTMNDIDRSVESMDFAMRRRFAFHEITAKDSAQAMLNEQTFNAMLAKDEISQAVYNNCVSNLEILKTKMSNLNLRMIDKSEDEKPLPTSQVKIGLTRDYQIGAAYFLKFVIYAEEETPFDKLWENHIEGVIKEYLRGTGDEDEKMQMLANAYGYQSKRYIDQTENN